MVMDVPLCNILNALVLCHVNFISTMLVRIIGVHTPETMPAFILLLHWSCDGGQITPHVSFLICKMGEIRETPHGVESLQAI